MADNNKNIAKQHSMVISFWNIIPAGITNYTKSIDRARKMHNAQSGQHNVSVKYDFYFTLCIVIATKSNSPFDIYVRQVVHVHA